MSLVKHAESDAWLALGLCFFLNVLPLTRQLSNLSGSLWSKALQGQRAQRIEMLLLHEFHHRKFMLPDKLSIKVSAKNMPELFVAFLHCTCNDLFAVTSKHSLPELPGQFSAVPATQSPKSMYDTPPFVGASLFDCLLCLPEYLLACMHASAYLLLECG